MSENFLIDLSPSCTKEQAVLRLLGWGKETITKKFIKMNSSGKVETEIKEISPTVIDLHELLTETYQEALQRYEEATPEDPTEEEINTLLEEHGPRILEAEEFIAEAHGYLMDITDELARPDGALRVDQDATAKSGTTFITIRSLEEWASKRYAKKGEGVELKSVLDNEKSSGGTDDFFDEKSISNRSFLLTLGLSIRAFAEDKGSIYKKANGLNILQISKKVFEFSESIQSAKKPFHGQGFVSIQKRLAQAEKYVNRFI